MPSLRKKNSEVFTVFFVGILGVCVISVLQSISIMRDPEGYWRSVARAEKQAKAQAEARAEAAAIAAQPSRSDYKTVEVVTACDIAARRSVKNPSSFSTAWSWEEVPTERGVMILRDFTAMNGFGANVDNYYICKYDAISQKFVSLDFAEGNY